MPKRPHGKPSRPNKSDKPNELTEQSEGAPSVRSIWSGNLTFGLVSIPVDMFSAVRPRQKAMKMVDKDGNALGRQYHCSADGKELSADELVRGYESESGKMVVITDQEFQSLAPETSSDIDLMRFVPQDQIPPIYYDRPYFLAPAGRSAKAYNLLAKALERTERVAIGRFVMRGHEYLVAILSDHGVLRADTLRRADEIRSPETIDLPKPGKPSAQKIALFAKEIEQLTKDKLNMADFEDLDAHALQRLAHSKEEKGKDVVNQRDLEPDNDDAPPTAKVIDFMEVLRKSLSKKALVKTAESARSVPEPPAEAPQSKRSRPKKKISSSRKN